MSALGRPAEATAELGPGSRLGPYQLVYAVVQGGMARVWAALDTTSGSVVAVKTIRPELAHDAGYRRLFEDEARYASSVEHPNVCRVFGLAEEGGVLYIAMEWVVGESLARIIKPAKSAPAEPVEPRMGARLMADFCVALHAAHELRDEKGSAVRLVHADVSLQNLMVTRQGGVKLVDFGVARARTTGSRNVPKMDGKAAYMAPEHAAGKRLSRLSDVFTLGICLYEVTTGKRPFATGNWDATIERLLAGEFVPPSELSEDYPPELERVLLRAMAQSPAHRFPSALRMKRALEDWLRKSGPPIGPGEVAAFLEQRAGPGIAQREDYIAQTLGRAPAKR